MNKIEVLTNSGWILFDDLVGGEKICSLNPEKNTIEYVEYVTYIIMRK